MTTLKRSIPFVAMLLATAVATAEDPARLFPAETKIFIAWDGVFKDWPGVVDRIVEKYPEFVADAFDEDVLAALRLAEDVIRHPGAVGLTRLDMEGDFAVAAFVQPKDAADEKRMLADLEHVLQSSDWEMQDCRLSGHAMRQGVQEGITINWGAVNGHVLFAVGANGLDNVVALIDGSGGASLADDNSYKDAIRRLPPTSDGGVVIYANAQKMMDIIRGGMESVGADAEFVEAILGATGLSSVQYKIIRSSGGWNNWRFDVFARINGPYNGILRAFDQKPLTKEDISLIPEDAYMAYVGNFDLAALWEETLNVISEVEPGMLPTVEGGIEAATPFLGFSIPNDLFPAIGDTWAIYNAPETGGPLGFVMVVDARDPQKLLAAAQRINELIDLGVSNVGARLIKKEMKHNGTTIHYMAGYRGPAPVAPAWALKGDRMFMGLFPQCVAGALDQLDARTSVLSKPDVADAMGRLPQPLTGFGYLNGRLLRESYYAYELAMVAVTQSLLGQDFADIGAYPLASEVLAQNQDSLFGAAKVDGGIRWSYAGTGAVITIPVATMAFAISTALPELSHARANAKRVVSSANLRGIGMAAMIYHENHGAWPDSFDQLIEDQLVTRETIISPTVSDKVPVGYVLITGFSKDAAPTLILAYEKVTDVGQIPTLFMDGHVEILDYSTLSDMLRATYEALDEEPQDPVWGFE